MPGGAELERLRLIVAAGLDPADPASYTVDAPRLQQLAAARDPFVLSDQRSDDVEAAMAIITAMFTSGRLSDANVTSAIDSRVTTRVPIELAANPTVQQGVTDAIAAQMPPAVATEVSKAGVLSGTANVIGLDENEVFVIGDSVDRKSWLAIGPDGGIPPRVQAIIKTMITSGLLDQWFTANALNRSLSIVGQSDKESFYIDDSGAVGFSKLDKTTQQYIIDFITASGSAGIPTQYKGALGSTYKISSGLDIICWGDSLTAGAGGATIPSSGIVTSSYTYPSRLQELLTTRGVVSTVTNAGVGGESSVTITARANGNPLLMIPQGGSIPTSGTIAVDLQQINGITTSPLLQGGATTGRLVVGSNVIPGSISLSSGVYYFTRTTGGSAISTLRPCTFYYDYADSHRGDIHVIWIGQNGPSDARARADTQAIIQRMSALDKRFIIIARPTNNDADDAAWFDLYGRRYIAWRKYASTYGLSDVGITATSQDNTDMAAGGIPVSLRIDGVHGNAAYYWILGNLVFNRLVELGWV